MFAILKRVLSLKVLCKVFLSSKMMHKITSFINNNIAIASVQTGRNSDSIAGKNIKIISPVFLSVTKEKMEQI